MPGQADETASAQTTTGKTATAETTAPKASSGRTSPSKPGTPTTSTQEQAAAGRLRKFFAKGINQTTRERIFFDRLSFDLKIAAARADYHLHIYEPDVDRDGFDFIVEDVDLNRRWLQMKAKLDDMKPPPWKILVDLLRPDAGESIPYDFGSAEAGRAGGVVLIEIDTSTPYGEVTYSYTDIHIIAAISQRFLIPRPWPGRGKRPTKDVAQKAADVLQQLKTLTPTEQVPVPEELFIRLAAPDALLSLMALRTPTTQTDFAPSAIWNAWVSMEIGDSGKTVSVAPEVSTLYAQLTRICALQPASTKKKRTLFDPFTWIGRAPPVE